MERLDEYIVIPKGIKSVRAANQWLNDQGRYDIRFASHKISLFGTEYILYKVLNNRRKQLAASLELKPLLNYAVQYCGVNPCNTRAE